MYVDPTGHSMVAFGAILVGAFIGAVISALTSVVTQLEQNGGDLNEINLAKVGFDAFVGAINGGLAAYSISIGWSIALGAIMGFVSSIASDTLFNGGQVDMYSAIKSAFIGGIAGAIAGSGANCVKDGMHVTKFVNGKIILKKTIANGSRRVIARQTNALNVHAKQLMISAVRYLASNTFSMAYTMDTN